MTATRSTAIRMGTTIVGTNRSFIEAPSLRGAFAIPAANPHHNTGRFNRGVDVDQRSALERSFSSLILTSIAQAWSQATSPLLTHKKSGLAFSRPRAYRHSGSSLNRPSVAATRDGRVYREPKSVKVRRRWPRPGQGLSGDAAWPAGGSAIQCGGLTTCPSVSTHPRASANFDSIRKWVAEPSPSLARS